MWSIPGIWAGEAILAVVDVIAQQIRHEVKSFCPLFSAFCAYHDARIESSAVRSLMPHLVEVTDVGDAADAEVAPRHVGRHRQQAVPIQLPVLHLKKKDNWGMFTLESLMSVC